MDDEGMSACRLEVRVVPGAKSTAVERMEDGSWKVRLRARPVEGQANAALGEELRKWLGVSRSAIRIVRGETSRRKIVEIAGLDTAGVESRLRMVCHDNGA